MVVYSQVLKDLEILQKETDNHFDILTREITSINGSWFIYKSLFSSNVRIKQYKQKHYLEPIQKALIRVKQGIECLQDQEPLKKAIQLHEILCHEKTKIKNIAYKNPIITDDYSSTYPNSMNQSISYAKDRGRTGKIISKSLGFINRLFENIKNHFEDLINEYVANSISPNQYLNPQENKDELFKKIKGDVFKILEVTDSQLLEEMVRKAFNSCIDNEKRSASDISDGYELNVMTPS